VLRRALLAAPLLIALHVAIGQVRAPAAAALTATLKDPAVTESSGVVASRANRGVYWTHNDSGDGPVLYAFDGAGRSYGRWTVPGAQSVDWEDIAIGPAPGGRWYLYAADIGDNLRRRPEVVVYRVEEPQMSGAPACARACRTGPAMAFRLRYPDGPHNAEALLVHPVTGDLYIVSKADGGDMETTVYVARAGQLGAAPVTLAAIARLDVPDRMFRAVLMGITGGEISPDGRSVALCDYRDIHVASLPPGAAFDEIWKQPFSTTAIGAGAQIEAICFRPDGRRLVLTSEGAPCPVYEIKL
jgi:hypothetical protein